MARSASDIRTQIGFEVTPGTAVAATRRLRSTQFATNPKQEVETFRAMGFRTATHRVKHREMSMGAFEGALNMAELLPILASRFGAPTPQQIGSTTGYTWTFTPAAGAPGDTPKTLTIEKGDTTGATRVAYAVVNDFKMEINNVNSGKISGNLIGRAPQSVNSVTTSGVSFYPFVPMAASSYDLWLAASYADAVAQQNDDKLAGAIDTISIDVGEQFVAFQPFESDFESFKELTQRDYTVKVELTLNNSPAARSVRDALKANPLPTRFLRLRSRGPQFALDGATPIFHEFAATFALQYMADEEVDNVQEVFGVKLMLESVFDPVSGIFHEYEITTNVSAL